MLPSSCPMTSADGKGLRRRLVVAGDWVWCWLLPTKTGKKHGQTMEKPWKNYGKNMENQLICQRKEETMLKYLAIAVWLISRFSMLKSRNIRHQRTMLKLNMKKQETGRNSSNVKPWMGLWQAVSSLHLC